MVSISITCPRKDNLKTRDSSWSYSNARSSVKSAWARSLKSWPFSDAAAAWPCAMAAFHSGGRHRLRIRFTLARPQLPALERRYLNAKWYMMKTWSKCCLTHCPTRLLHHTTTTRSTSPCLSDTSSSRMTYEFVQMRAVVTQESLTREEAHASTISSVTSADIRGRTRYTWRSLRSGE